MAQYHPPPPNGITTAAGVAMRTAVPRVVQVVGPASYAAGGFQVDCSTFFSSIICAMFVRSFDTAGGAWPATANRRMAQVGEAATDVYASAKFRAISVRTFSSVTPTFTGAALGGGHSCGAVGCDSSHPNTSTVAAGTISTIGSANLAEQTAATDLSGATYEFLVWGVPI